MSSSQNRQDFKDSKFRNDKITNLINNFVTLNDGEKKENTSHVKKVIEDTLIPLMKEQDNLFRERFNSIMYGGSFFKNTKVGKPDEYDLDLILHLPLKPETLKFITPGNKPGFVKIQLTKNSKLPDWEARHWTKLNEFIDVNNFMDQNKFREWMESVIDKALNSLPKDPNFGGNERNLRVDGTTYRISTKKSGPAFTLKIEVPEGNVIDVDLVPCLGFSIPPPNGYSVKNKRTVPKSNKRPKDIRKNKNWFAIPKPVPEEDGNLMWRLCFYEHEKEKLKGPMKTVIRLLKKLRNTQDWTNLSSYFIETLALHELELQDPNFMRLSLTNILMHMLTKLRDAVKERSIPFFWCRRMNLLNQLSEEEMENIACRLQKIVATIDREIETNPYIIAKFVLEPGELEELSQGISKLKL